MKRARPPRPTTAAIALLAMLAGLPALPGCAAHSSRETCDDGVDNDGDGLTDCDDPSCAQAEGCLVGAEICDDGVDNDQDGVTDCDDPDCLGAPICAPPELCGDGRDNDGDGLSDCADPDCDGDPACVGAELCDDGLDNDGDGLADCDDPDCVTLPACQLVERCFDGVDNDGDGAVDCADPDCAPLPACQGTVERCDDGVDNDGDGLVDCDDPDCHATPGCLPPDACAGATDGDHCGTDLGGTAVHGSLYTCAGGATAGVIVCANGCADGDCNPTIVDPCQSASAGNGAYCGESLTAGTPGTLYQCQGGTTASSEVCPSGCKVNPPGTPDTCQPTGDPCASATAGNGYYCGDNLTGGLSNVLYYCQNGITTAETTCPNGCQPNPPGTPDQCVPSGTGSCCLQEPAGSLTQAYSACGLGGSHYGRDYGAALGTPIYAGITGTVVSHALGYPNCYSNGCTQACWNAFNYVKLRADCGDPNVPGNDLYVYYLHIDSLAPGVGNGTHLGQGDLLAAVGNSGCSTGPHIHLEVVSVPAGQAAYLSTCSAVDPPTRYCP